MNITKSNYKNHLLFLFLALIGISSCIDPINLTLEEGGEFLVIDANFTSNRPSHEVQLYYTTSLRTKGQRPIEGAQIVLVEEGQLRESYEELKRGRYRLDTEQIKGEAGKKYHIEITLPTGQAYQSRPEILPERIRGDSVFFEFALREELGLLGGLIKRPFVEVYVATPLPTTQSYWLKWDIKNMFSFTEPVCSPFGPPPNTCFITPVTFTQEVNLLSGASLEADYLPKLKIGEQQLSNTDFEFRGRNYYLANQQSITKEAYTYWNQINLVANQSGSIFDAPPAEVRGNFFNVDNPDEIVLGYFEVSNTDSLRAFLTEGDLVDFHQFATNYCATFNDRFSMNRRECCNCQSIDEELTIERPSWW